MLVHLGFPGLQNFLNHSFEGVLGYYAKLLEGIQGKSQGDGVGFDENGDNGGHHFYVLGDWTE